MSPNVVYWRAGFSAVLAVFLDSYESNIVNTPPACDQVTTFFFFGGGGVEGVGQFAFICFLHG